MTISDDATATIKEEPTPKDNDTKESEPVTSEKDATQVNSE